MNSGELLNVWFVCLVNEVSSVDSCVTLRNYSMSLNINFSVFKSEIMEGHNLVVANFLVTESIILTTVHVGQVRMFL